MKNKYKKIIEEEIEEQDPYELESLGADKDEDGIDIPSECNYK